MQKQRSTEKNVPAAKKTDKTSVGVSKGMPAHPRSPSHSVTQRLISPGKSSLVAKEKQPPSSHTLSQARSYASAAGTRSQRSESGGIAATHTVTPGGSENRSEHLISSERVHSAPASRASRDSSRSRLTCKAARSLAYNGGRAEDEGAGGGRFRSPSWSPASRQSDLTGGTSAARSPHTVSLKGTAESLNVQDMEEDCFNVPQIFHHMVTKTDTTKMDDNMTPVPVILKMATNTAHTTNVTTKMATTPPKTISTAFKTMTYNPHMPLEMAEDLPPSAGLIIQLIQDLRVDLKNYLKKDFDNMYGILENIGQRKEAVEHRLSTQESAHLELEKTVKELQKQVNQQA
ncbi:Hypothetical predicted protein [Pelobates cultripes]|uniref:Uncharacterized protein n=1 Tax=Pelobates cultripes TaxID=61616 RepID=A0AAD1SH27_PELCU|nr:Hypothetical predicted protein [Pelobates cultripes]